MSRFRSYLNTSVKVVEAYKGEKPLAIFLKEFFAENKKYGARDRRQISSLCYYHFRLGRSAETLATEEKILLGTFLCENEHSEFLETLKPAWDEKVSLPFAEKYALVKDKFNIETIFPFADELSEGIDTKFFYASFLIQPDLFLRIRPRVRLGVLKKLERSKLTYQLINDDCVALPNSTKVEEHFLPDKEVIIQDLNSQKTLDFFKPQEATFKTPLTAVWDCCAASGGKSILLFDIFNQRIDLTISDLRQSIIFNLHHRFIRTGIKNYSYFIADLTGDQFETTLTTEQRAALKPQIIICDVPCTGSGTWGRTPEQLHFFEPEKIIEYSKKQKQIVSNVIPHLQKNGVFVYITCSVFKKENEEVADLIKEKFGLQLIKKELLKGYDKKADTMFVAVFRK